MNTPLQELGTRAEAVSTDPETSVGTVISIENRSLGQNQEVSLIWLDTSEPECEFLLFDIVWTAPRPKHANLAIQPGDRLTVRRFADSGRNPRGHRRCHVLSTDGLPI